MKINIRLLSILSLAVMLALVSTSIAPVSSAYASAFVVNSTNDLDDSTCNAIHCSLREAINEANNISSDDTITFSVSGTIPLTSILPIIDNNGSLTIDGGNTITISGDTDSNNTGDVQVLYVFPNANLTLRNITVTRGMNTIDSGGAIKSYGHLTIENSTISNSSTTTAISMGGGGVFTSSGGATLTVTNSTFSGNTATYFGGGIYNAGSTVSISNSTFSGNQSTANSGGGIYNSTGSLTIVGSAFSNNSANSSGGGIHNNTGSGTVSITDTTFSGNQAVGSGGGISATNGAISISNSTFTNNTAINDAGGTYVTGSGSVNITNSTFFGNSTSNRGGGIFAFGSVALTNVTISGNTAPSDQGGGVHTYGALTLKNTIIANGGTGGDCILSGSGSIAGDSIHNLIEATASNACGLTNVNNNIIGSDPALGSLTGSPAYLPLNSGSPAINAGDDATCAATPVSNTSQNGLPRPQGAHCDIGSYELDNIAPTVTMSSAALNPTNTSPIAVTVQFSETVTGFLAGDITPGNGIVGNFVAVDGDTYNFDLTPSGQGPVTADIAAGVATDLAGNGNTIATPFSRTYDTVTPTVTISSLVTDPTNSSPIAVTVQFSETVTGFLASDIAPGNGTVANFVAVDGDTYTFDLTPSGQGLVTANIAAGVASDSAGNGNTIATQFSRTYSVTYNLFLPLILR